MKSLSVLILAILPLAEAIKCLNITHELDWCTTNRTTIEAHSIECEPGVEWCETFFLTNPSDISVYTVNRTCSTTCAARNKEGCVPFIDNTETGLEQKSCCCQGDFCNVYVNPTETIRSLTTTPVPTTNLSTTTASAEPLVSAAPTLIYSLAALATMIAVLN